MKNLHQGGHGELRHRDQGVESALYMLIPIQRLGE
jgi:hypothetical protein